jgi:hypothetical protein
MFIVAPSGRTKPLVLGDIFKTSRLTCRLVGRVALDELVVNAVTRTARTSRQN